MRQLTATFTALVAGLALGACASALESASLGNLAASKSVLLAGVSTDFKDDLRREIIARYADCCTIDVADLSELENVDDSLYDAIIILDTTRVWTLFNLQIRSFMERVVDPNAVIIHLTATLAWSFEYRGIDAITSASSEASEAASLKRIFARADSLLR